MCGDGHTLHFWRSPNGAEVDFVWDAEVGIEVKAATSISNCHLRGLEELGRLTRLRRKIVVCREPSPHALEDIEVMPWRVFIEQLWAGRL